MFSKEAKRLIKDMKDDHELREKVRNIIKRGKEVLDTYESPQSAGTVVAELESSMVRELGYDIDAPMWMLNAKKIFRASGY